MRRRWCLANWRKWEWIEGLNILLGIELTERARKSRKEHNEKEENLCFHKKFGLELERERERGLKLNELLLTFFLGIGGGLVLGFCYWGLVC